MGCLFLVELIYQYTTRVDLQIAIHRCYAEPVELRHLRYFMAVAEALSFTRASAKLRVAQPAISRQIHDLEEELGVSLLERNSRSVRLTPAGHAFLLEARAVLDRAGEAVQTAKAFGSGLRGHIHLGYAPSPSIEILPQALHACHADAPRIQVIPHDLSTEGLLTGLREATLDAALMVPSNTAAMRGLTFEKLRTYPVCVAVHRTHRLARARRVTLDDLAGESLVAYSRRDYPDYHDWLEGIFRTAGRSPSVGEEQDSATSLIAAVEACAGVAVVPSCMASLSGPRLKLREITPAPPPLVVGLAYCRKDLSPAAKRFVESVRKLAAAAPV
jgi:DNA-binding transcriptional LysR family regulator